MSFYRCVSPKTGVFFQKNFAHLNFFLFVYRKAKKCLVLQIDGEIEPTRMAVWVGVQVQEGIPIWQATRLLARVPQYEMERNQRIYNYGRKRLQALPRFSEIRVGHLVSQHARSRPVCTGAGSRLTIFNLYGRVRAGAWRQAVGPVY